VRDPHIHGDPTRTGRGLLAFGVFGALVAGFFAPSAAPSEPPAVSQFLAGWAAPEGAENDTTTGYPKKIRRAADGMVMVLIPAGTFEMGPVPGDSDAFNFEKPRHAVTLSKAYYLDEHEVTNEQFAKFAAATGHKTTAETAGKGYAIKAGGSGWEETSGVSWRTPLVGGKRPTEWERHPVVLMSWDDAIAFATWAKVALPTEAQFERALRGGVEGKKYPWGDSLPPPRGTGNYAGAEVKKALSKWTYPIVGGHEDAFAQTAPVRSFSPNPYGLYDASGNVWEWCADAFDKEYYSKSPPMDPTGPSGAASSRVLRGGSWDSDAGNLRSSVRSGVKPTIADDLNGFRCARSLP